MSKQQYKVCLIQQLFDIAWDKAFAKKDSQSTRAISEASKRLHEKDNGVSYLED